MEALALKYRPQRFSDVVCQKHIMQILSSQIEYQDFKQGYLFCGGAGTGKTTTARIFGKEVNGGKGKTIEIDGASNNGVDNIRALIEDCKMKPLDAKYKVYIVDECHMLSIGAWNAFLKVLEEPPKHVIFILCTTDPQKIPPTILSRVQRFDFQRIPSQDIVDRLQWIIAQENRDAVMDNCGSKDALADEEWAIKEGIPVISFHKEALEYIAKLADGGMRDAITKLDTVLGYTMDITAENVLACLGLSSYDSMSNLLLGVIYNKGAECLQEIDKVFMGGKDLKLYIKDLSKYVLDITKYALTKQFDITHIPASSQDQAIKIAKAAGQDFLLDMLDAFNKLYNTIKYEQTPRAMIESEVLLLCMKS